MTNFSLRSCRLKIDRAKKHRRDLETEIEDFIGRNPYRIITDRDTEPAIRIDRLHIVENVPIGFSGLIGDCVHNLRSALDALAIGLAMRDSTFRITDKRLRLIQFPIQGDAIAFGNAIARLPFDDASKTILLKLEAYRGGKGNSFWVLNRLDVFDKHRAIIPATSGLVGVRHNSSSVEIVNLRGKFPLKDGDELARHAFHEPEFDANANFAFEVAFDEGQPLAGKGVLLVLDDFIDITESIIDAFARNIFKAEW